MCNFRLLRSFFLLRLSKIISIYIYKIDFEVYKIDSIYIDFEVYLGLLHIVLHVYQTYIEWFKLLKRN